jgi:hypothetical protein
MKDFIPENRWERELKELKSQGYTNWNDYLHKEYIKGPDGEVCKKIK